MRIRRLSIALTRIFPQDLANMSSREVACLDGGIMFRVLSQWLILEGWWAVSCGWRASVFKCKWYVHSMTATRNQCSMNMNAVGSDTQSADSQSLSNGRSDKNQNRRMVPIAPLQSVPFY